MEKSLELIKGFLATQLNYIPALCVVFAIYFGILKAEPALWKFALLAVVPFGFYLIRRFVKNIILFFALHLGWAVWPFFLAKNIAEIVIFILLGVVFFAVSVYFKMTAHAPEDGVLFVAMTAILAIAAYFIALSGSGEKAAGYIALLAIIYVVYFMTHEYIAGYINYIKNNEVSNQSIPKQHIFKTSASTLVGFVTLFVGFALLLVKANWLSGFIGKIGNLIKRFIIWLLSFAPEAMEQGTPQNESEAIEQMYEMGENVEPVYQLPPEIIELIDRIVTIGAYVIFGTFVIIITYALFRAVIAAFKVKRDDNEEEVVLVKEKVTKIKKARPEKKERENQLSKNKKIRKMYEELVWKKNLGPKADKDEKKIVANRLKYQNPQEQCRYLVSGEAIRRMYEKARYSDNEITKNDVGAMKEICALEAKSR